MELFPPIPLAEWRDTKETLHRFAQIVGKIRLAASTRRNHWWNVPFHLTGRGITTRPMGQVDGNPIFTIDFDFVDHQLVVATLDGRTVAFPLPASRLPPSTSDAGSAGSPGHPGRHRAPPALRSARSGRPFAEDTEHAAYDPVQANRYWQVLSQVALRPGGVRRGLLGQGQPGAPLLAHLRHRPHPVLRPTRRPAAADRPGHPGGVLPRSDQLRLLVRRRRLHRTRLLLLHRPRAGPPGRGAAQPATAHWSTAPAATWPCCVRRGPHRADPKAAVLAFYESAYLAGARRAGWDIERMACPGGVTDPHQGAHRPGDTSG